MGMTPLMIAAQCDSSATVKLLLQLGAKQAARMLLATDNAGALSTGFLSSQQDDMMLENNAQHVCMSVCSSRVQQGVPSRRLIIWVADKEGGASVPNKGRPTEPYIKSGMQRWIALLSLQTSLTDSPQRNSIG